MQKEINVIATTISGSISDWGKVKRIKPLFAEHGMGNVTLHEVDSHAEAKEIAKELAHNGKEIIISAGGSGTFNSVLEGSLLGSDDPSRIQLGFLRKGSADLLGKSLDMPDEIESAIKVFVDVIREERTIPCDILKAYSDGPNAEPRHFVGYGGAEIFGLIPRFTENRFIKYYKGILSQLFGDLGPFRVGNALAVITRSFSFPRRNWVVSMDGKKVYSGRMQALIITNGDLGPDMPFARNEPLGSGRFHLFLISDLGLMRLPGQILKTWNGSVQNDPAKYGYMAFSVQKQLKLSVKGDEPFPLNVDGSTLVCHSQATVELSGSVQLLSGRTV